MLRFFSSVAAFLIICTSLLMGISGLSGRPLGGDVFLYLTQLNDAQRNAVIYAFDARTGVVQRILQQPDMLDFTTSPDGRFLLYRKRENRATSFYILDLYSRNSELLLAGDIGTPRWSPDGQWIAFRCMQRDAQGLYIIPAAGGEAQRLTEQPYGVFSWSPDSQSLIYAIQLESNWGIFSVALTGGQADLLLTFDGYLTRLAGHGEPVLAVIDSLPQQYDFISGKYEILSQQMVFTGHPTWSPQKDRWAFVSVSPDGSDWGLTIYDTEGELLRVYQPQGLSISSPLVWWLSG